MRILLVEDNVDLVASLSDYLTLQGHQCDYAYNGQSALELIQLDEYDLFIVDVAMPKMNGLEFCKTLRCELKNLTPLLFLTARDSLDDKLAGFDVGADDYLVKPFALKELHARILAIYQRYMRQEERIEVDDLIVNLVTGEVTRSGEKILLGPSTYKLLVALMQNSPALVSRSKLEYMVWGDDCPDSDSLRSHIYKLRNKIDKPFGRPLIQTIKGRGFKVA